MHTVQLREWGKSLFTVAAAQQIMKVWNDVRSVGYDVAVDLQGAMRSALLARWSGARAVYGAAEPREAPASLWYTRRAIARGAHVVEQNFSLAEAVAQRRLAMPGLEFPRDRNAEQQMNRRLAEAGIRVYEIRPGLIETDMTREFLDSPANAAIIARTPAGRWGQPDELVGAAVFLASRAATFITGVTLPVDGGYSVF